MRKIVLILALLIAGKSFAVFPVVDVGATEQLITSVANQVVILNNQYQMLKGIAKNGIHISDFTDTVNKLKRISDSGLAVSYATKDLDSKFNKVFGDGKSSEDQQKNQNQSMLDTALNTLKSASAQLSYVQKEARAVTEITNNSNSASGALAVAQGTNQLINSTNSQLQSLTTMTAQSSSIMATKMAQEAATNKAINEERAKSIRIYKYISSISV